MNELDLFAAAIAIADPTERGSLLDRECAGRPEIRQRLIRLLEAHVQSHPMLDHVNRRKPEVTGEYNPPATHLGTLIAGRYKLLEEIGDGGMGTVWMAEQKEPVKRLVAVKLIKAGMDSKAVLARFEAERQALAMMDHPNIAKVYDAGTDTSGRPYFVMELVKGLPLTEYCDARKLSVNDRSGDQPRPQIGISILDGQTYQPLVNLDCKPTHYRNWVRSFSRDGRKFLAFYTFADSSPDECRIWDTTTGKLLRTFRFPAGFRYSVELSPDGSRILMLDGSGRLLLLDADTGEEMLALQFPLAQDARFDRSGRKIAVVSPSEVRLLDATPLPEPKK